MSSSVVFAQRRTSEEDPSAVSAQSRVLEMSATQTASEAGAVTREAYQWHLHFYERSPRKRGQCGGADAASVKSQALAAPCVMR